MRSQALALGVLMFTVSLGAEVRPPAVAGAFYPGVRRDLEKQVNEYLSQAPAGAAQPVAMIVPHAGYVFSGATTGKVFAGLKGAEVRRVILLGPSHQAGFGGGALPGERLTAFSTPLGELPLDREALYKLRSQPGFDGPTSAHTHEHCLEVELPFVQATVGEVPIVPILVGHATDRTAARAMARGIAGILAPGTVIVVSSDFTHHGPSYRYSPFPRDRSLVQRLEDLGRATAERAAGLDTLGFWHQVEVSGDTVCGNRPISVLLEILNHAFDGTGKIVDVTTSAEVSGNLDQVVTYVGVAYGGTWRPWREDGDQARLSALGENERKAAVSLARATIATHLDKGPELARWFAEHGATGNLTALAGVFVTINNTGEKAVRQGRLRGCIGVIEAREPLLDAIVHAAVSATRDPRFPPLESRELPEVSLEVSVLSPTWELPGPDTIEMGTHGVILSKGGRSAVFLPQVATETGWDRDTFLSQLARKAGLGADAWRHGATFEVFTAQVFGEHE